MFNPAPPPFPVRDAAARSPQRAAAPMPVAADAALLPTPRIVAAPASFSSFSTMAAFFCLTSITVDNTSYQGFPCSN